MNKWGTRKAKEEKGSIDWRNGSLYCWDMDRKVMFRIQISDNLKLTKN